MNTKNLVSISERTTNEQREIRKKGGIASGVARRKKRDAKQSISNLLSLAVADETRAMLKVPLNYDKSDNLDAMTAGMFMAAVSGNVNAYRALLEYGELTPESKRDKERWELERAALIKNNGLGGDDSSPLFVPDASLLRSPAFDTLAGHIWRHTHTHYWLKGGRGSTKSSFISLEIPRLLIANPNVHAVVLRKVGKTLRNSVIAQMLWAVEQLGLMPEFSAKMSPPEITLKRTGQKIYFFGVDDPQKVKSIKPLFGYVGIVWLEELDQFAGMEEVRNINQSLLRGGDKFWEFCSFNPPKSVHNWVNQELLYEKPDRLVSHSTYLDVPPEWLGDQFLLEADELKARNEAFYRHEYLGEVTGTGGAVFDNVEDKRLSDEEINAFDYRYYGLDFGFTLDPLAFVALSYDAKRAIVYIFDEIYQQNLMNHEAAELIAPRAKGGRIIADSAEPKSIAELKTAGLAVFGAKKAPDSVRHGIRWLQSRAKIYIDKRRCPNAFREFVTYEYERTRDGQFISAYPDKDNHTIDAVRYGLSPVMKSPNFSFL